MTEETYSDKIMIYKPYYVNNISLNLEECVNKGIMKVSDLITFIKHNIDDKECEVINDDIFDVNYKSIYIKNNECLLGLLEDKSLIKMFDFFKADELSLTCILVMGGASVNVDNGYKLVIHTNEDIHEHLPHVHVNKAGASVRYHLDTLKRFEEDVCPREYKRDEKKIIVPCIEKHLNKLKEFWNLNMNGYVTPHIDENGMQYYKES